MSKEELFLFATFSSYYFFVFNVECNIKCTVGITFLFIFDAFSKKRKCRSMIIVCSSSHFISKSNFAFPSCIRQFNLFVTSKKRNHEFTNSRILKQAKNAFFVFLTCFRAYVGQPDNHIQACRPWVCRVCHGTPRFWQIS